MKRSDQEIKQPSKQQEPICPVASKMQNGHMAIKSMIISQTAEMHGACGKPFRPSLTTSPPQACDDDTSLPDALNHRAVTVAIFYHRGGKSPTTAGVAVVGVIYIYIYIYTHTHTHRHTQWHNTRSSLERNIKSIMTEAFNDAVK